MGVVYHFSRIVQWNQQQVPGSQLLVPSSGNIHSPGGVPFYTGGFVEVESRGCAPGEGLGVFPQVSLSFVAAGDEPKKPTRAKGLPCVLGAFHDMLLTDF